MMRFAILACSSWLVLFLPAAAPGADFQSKYCSIELSRSAPRFNQFCLDCLGKGRLEQDLILRDAEAPAGLRLVPQSPGRWAYVVASADGKAAPVWTVFAREKGLVLRSDYVAGKAVAAFRLQFNQRKNHATLLGLMQPGERRVGLPCVLHLPDLGSARITCNVPGWKLDYDARRFVPQPLVRIEFPCATAEHPQVEYNLEVAAIHPQLPGIEGDPRFDGFRRDYLNVLQVNPRVQMLANNSSSDPVPFTLFIYSQIARYAPPLAEGLTGLDLIRMTLDRYLAGVKGYGQPGYACQPGDADLIAWQTPWTSLDTYPSLLIAACDYIEGAQDWAWARANYDKLAVWSRQMMASDKDGNGLIEYPGTGNLGDRPVRQRMPSNWWDAINFGHEDAYANALAYHACQGFARVASTLNHPADAQSFREKAARLRAAYVRTFLNPRTGVLAGWKSADGQLHDYWFTFVQGVAISYGLVDDQVANAIMDRLLGKMRAVGYTNFALGLPGNLVPVRKGDYLVTAGAPEPCGAPRREDGSDGFQFYENGGATGCFAYFTIKALYRLGRREDARRILYPMLDGYAAGDFQGFGPNGMSRDWRDWHGGCHGYEGLLVDNYLTLLACLDDREAAK